MPNELVPVNNEVQPSPMAISDAPTTVEPTDLRSVLMNLPADQANVVMAEYKLRRLNFRKWLKEQLVQGVHYGYPPGVEPKFDSRGNLVQRSFDKRKNEWKETTVAPTSWTVKPSLYKAGADFLCDLLAVRDEYHADLDSWKQLGSPSGMFVQACRLYSRATGELLGEGRGVREVGQKGGDANNAIKMAKKSAKVDAVLNTWGLADLFTQDVEDKPDAPPPHPEVDRDQNAPKQPPRAQRQPPVVTADQLGSLVSEWKQMQTDNGADDLTPEAFARFVATVTVREFNCRIPAQWTKADYDKCRRTIRGEE